MELPRSPFRFNHNANYQMSLRKWHSQSEPLFTYLPKEAFNRMRPQVPVPQRKWNGFVSVETPTSSCLVQSPMSGFAAQHCHSTGKNPPSLLSTMRQWPREKKGILNVTPQTESSHVKVCLGNMKVSIFWTCCCWQHVFNLQHKFIGSLSAREPDGPGYW